MSDWLIVMRRYVVAIAIGNLAWEFAQLPLYTIWHQGSVRQILFAALHCTAGDIVIAVTALVGALAVAGSAGWPRTRFPIVAVVTVVAGALYAVFSEWVNTEIRGSWAYTEWMPTLPLIRMGVAPLAQWLIVPPLALCWARRGAPGPRS